MIRLTRVELSWEWMSFTVASETGAGTNLVFTDEVFAEPVLVNAPGNAATAQVLFRKSRNALRDTVIVILTKRSTARLNQFFFAGAGDEDRDFCNCLINPFAILAAAVPNSEFTFPLATTTWVLESTTT